MSLRAMLKLLPGTLICGGATIAAAPAPTHYVSARMPVIGSGVALGAMRPAGLSPAASQLTPSGKPANTWTKLATIPGAVVHDAAFSSATTGYAAAELGQVWKTTDGGQSWTAVLNRGFPYYYYGVSVVGDTATVSGFDDSNSEAILTISRDGGATWRKDVVLSSNAWAGRVRNVHKLLDGLAMNGLGAGNPNAAWWTTAKDKWAQVTPDANGGWFGYQFTLLQDQTAYASGIQYCTSQNTGASWSCAAPADSVFDGPTEFVSDMVGWTGGGEISPNVAGWLHATKDGGAHWTGRVLTTPWPIREIDFLNKKIGWAAGGNVYSGVGGIYYSADGGRSWALDVSTGDEMDACAQAALSGGQTQIWCIGYTESNGNFTSAVYRTTVTTPK